VKDNTLQQTNRTTSASSASSAVNDNTPPYLAAGLITLLLLVVYVVTIAPTTQFWDTSEYIAAAKVLGIPHPPGNPLFVLIAHVWGMLPLAAHYALRINLLAAVTSALAAGFLFLVADRMLASTTTLPRWLRWLTAGAGTLLGATSFTVCDRHTVAGSPFTLSSRRCVHVVFIESALFCWAFISARLTGLLTHFPWLSTYIDPPAEITSPTVGLPPLSAAWAPPLSTRYRW